MRLTRITQQVDQLQQYRRSVRSLASVRIRILSLSILVAPRTSPLWTSLDMVGISTPRTQPTDRVLVFLFGACWRGQDSARLT